jgi:hypothetical protein
MSKRLLPKGYRLTLIVGSLTVALRRILEPTITSVDIKIVYHRTTMDINLQKYNLLVVSDWADVWPGSIEPSIPLDPHGGSYIVRRGLRSA